MGLKAGAADELCLRNALLAKRKVVQSCPSYGVDMYTLCRRSEGGRMEYLSLWFVESHGPVGVGGFERLLDMPQERVDV